MGWIKVTQRPMTDEEKDMLTMDELDELIDYEIYDCVLPEDGQEVLITTRSGNVISTTFWHDESGCFFENYEEDGDVLAWMPLPEPYKEEEEK